jgi:hypothetical protein
MFEAVNPAIPTAVFDNTAIGNDALRLTRRSGQVAVGAGALRNDTSGFFNTGVGYLSMLNNLSGVLNTALGTSSMRNNTTGGGNTALGGNAMNDHKTGSYNTAVGYESMYSDTAGAENTSVGWRSFRYTLAGIANTAIGVGALEFTDSATGNTAVGRGAMIGSFGNTSALGYNTVMGFYAGANMDSVANSTAIGTQAGFNNRGSENTFIGLNSGYGATAGNDLTGIENTGLGSSTLTFTTTGRSNTAVGMSSLYSNSTGSGNIGVGTRSLFYNSTASYNVAVGDSALIDNIDGSSNTGIGSFTNVSTGNLTNATAIGARAFVAQNNSIILGSINGVNNATADTRVGIRTTTPDSTFSVADNFLVGSSGTVQYDNSVPVMNYMFKSGSSNANRMVVAHSPGFPTWGLQYDDSNDRFNFLSGGGVRMSVGLGTGLVGIGMIPTTQLELSANSAQKPLSNTWLITSDERLKTINGAYTKGLADILKLNTIIYHYKEDNKRNLPTEEAGYGFSAQAVQKIFPEAVKTGKDGYLSFDFHPILVAYVNAFKEQQQIIEKQQKQIDDLIKRIEKLEQK